MADQRARGTVWVIVWAAAFIGAGCSDTQVPEATAERDETENTYTVGVDGSTEGFTGSFHLFFPDRLAVQAGDTIVFRRPDNGEPHTVTLATEPPEPQAIPGGSFFEGGFGGPPRKDMSMPCVLARGAPPKEGCSPEQRAPVAFDGKDSWFNSGGLLGDDEFVIELADNVAPGNYVFVCLVHTPRMQATVQVVEPGEQADDPTEVAARGRDNLEKARANARGLLNQPLNLAEGEVLAARADPAFSSWANEFSPQEIETPAGGTVTWTIRGLHTISFNAPESARPLYERAEDGSVQQNELAVKPQGEVAGWDGSGMLNSGLRTGLFPPARFSATFSVPGTYAYQCLVHFDMEGKVKVLG